MWARPQLALPGEARLLSAPPAWAQPGLEGMGVSVLRWSATGKAIGVTATLSAFSVSLLVLSKAVSVAVASEGSRCKVTTYGGIKCRQSLMLYSRLWAVGA